MVEYLSRLNQVNVTFTINYKTEFGQAISVVGEINRLGEWSDASKGCMKWHPGDIWKLTINVDRDKPFQYKYVVLDNKKQPIRWEEGRNRLCDPSYIATQDEDSASTHEEEDDLKSLCLSDEWEHFTVTFSIYYPGLSFREVMRINGDSANLGSWNKGSGPIEMRLGKPRKWLTGETVVPWELKKVRFTHKTMPDRLVYKYSILNTFNDVVVWEREPSRYLQILDPSEYGLYKEYGRIPIDGMSLEWRNVDKVFLVNGHIDKVDANFVSGMTFDKIDRTNIFIGPYPQTEMDVDILRQSGITAVLNVQTDIDLNHRSVNWPKMESLYRQNGILPVRYPIHDFNEADLTEKLFEGAQLLNSLINSEHHLVYVHCTAGMGRAPAVVLVYLCLFRPDYDYGFNEVEMDLPGRVDQFVRSFRSVSVPNMRAVRNVVKQAEGLTFN